MYTQMTFMDLPNATSLPGSADGALRCDSLDGKMPSPLGQPRCHASHGASPGPCLESSMNGTFSPCSLISSASAALQSSLESRLKARMPSAGLTGCRMEWRRLVTPSGRHLCALRASRATKGSGCIGLLLPTPPASEVRDWSRPSVLSRCDKGGRVARRICRLSSTARIFQEPVGLSPFFALEMMGFPSAWQDALRQETQLFLKQRRTS